MNTTDSLEPLDHGRVNLMDAHEVLYWCRDLSCTEAELREAVRQVGTHVAAVRDYLERREA